MRSRPLLAVVVILTALCATGVYGAGSDNKAPTETKPNRSGKSDSPALPPEKAQPARVPRFEVAPVIDGRLDDEVWKSAVVLKDFVQIQPGDNIAPSKSTEVLLGYDSKNWYIAFRCPDDAGKVRATVAKRDNVWSDDNVGMFIDTFNDKRKAYAFFFNPIGVQADGILTEGAGEDYSLDIVMESKGVVSEEGYTVEIAIPFKSLRFQAGEGKLWGAHFFRRIKRFNDELTSWMPVSRDDSSVLKQGGHITGFVGLSGERNLEIIPTFTASQSGRRIRTLPLAAVISDPTLRDPGRTLNPPVETDLGVSVKLGITPNVTFDFTANPDFAQVEADQPVVTANQRFPIFFAEKRPFFLEGIDIFQTPIRAVHTRAIIDPDYAVKLTGKEGRNTFGVLLASDNAPGNFSEEERTNPAILPSIARFLDKNAYIGVLRVKRDVGSESSIGFLGTSYNFIEKHNQLGGFDGRFRLDKQTVFSFQVLGTASRAFFRDLDTGERRYRTGNAVAYLWDYNNSGRYIGYGLSGNGRSRDYRADVGFTRRTNTNSNNVFIRYNSEPDPKAVLISWRVFTAADLTYDWDGRLQGWGRVSEGSVNLRHNAFVGGGFSNGRERLFEEEFGRRRGVNGGGSFFGGPERAVSNRTVWAFGGINPSKRYDVFAFVGRRWGSFDFDFGAGPRFPRVSPAALKDPDAPLDPGAANAFDAEISFSYQPTDALRTSINYTKARLTRVDTGLVAFNDNIFSSRTTYQFTRFAFARIRLDYSTLASSVRGQYLFGWTPNPGTSFFVGYNEALGFNGFSPFTGHLEPGFRRHARTFFIKTSYLIRRSL